MMRVLLIYPKLPLSFWSFSKALKYAGAKAHFPPLGMLTMAALLPEDWELRLADLNTRDLTEDDWEWAEMVMLSGMIAQHQSFLSLIEEAKHRGKTTVSGGPYPTSMPDEILSAGCDYIIKGEAENTIDLFLNALARKETDQGTGQIIENSDHCDMALSPLPRFDLMNPADYSGFLIQSSRGCPNDCEFCDIVSLYGRKPRYKTPEQIINELETLYQMGVRDHLFVCDDNFIGNKAHARAILRKMIPWNRRQNHPFGYQIQASVNLGQDQDLMDLLVAADFLEVFIGIETPDRDVLEKSHKFTNIKNPLLESLNNIKKKGLSVQGSFIIGFDGEKKGAGKRICDFVEATDIPIVMLNILNAPPGTNLWKRLEREERLLDDRSTGESTFTLLNYRPTRPEEEIMQEYMDAWEYLYTPSRYL